MTPSELKMQKRYFLLLCVLLIWNGADLEKLLNSLKLLPYNTCCIIITILAISRRLRRHYFLLIKCCKAAFMIMLEEDWQDTVLITNGWLRILKRCFTITHFLL